MERSTFDASQLQRKLVAIGATQHALAHAADMPDSAISAMFHGKEGIGEKRLGRLQDALHLLAMQAAEQKRAQAEAAAALVAEAGEATEVTDEAPPAQKPRPRIRRL